MIDDVVFRAVYMCPVVLFMLIPDTLSASSGVLGPTQPSELVGLLNPGSRRAALLIWFYDTPWSNVPFYWDPVAGQEFFYENYIILQCRNLGFCCDSLIGTCYKYHLLQITLIQQFSNFSTQKTFKLGSCRHIDAII